MSSPYTRVVLDEFYRGAAEFIETKRQLDGSVPLAVTDVDREGLHYIIAGVLAYLATRGKQTGHQGVIESLLVAMHEGNVT